MRYFCYILISEKTGKYYVGSTVNINSRLDKHHEGLVKSTARELPWHIIHTESFITLKEARQRELQIKRWHSRKAIESDSARKVLKDGIGISISN